MTTISYRVARIEDHAQIAKVHKKSFASFFLTSLGEHFLKTYYRSCLKNATTIAVCAIDENQNIVGFATGTDRAEGYHKHVFLSNFFSFIFSLFWAVIKRPKILLRLAKNMEKKTEIEDSKQYAELLSIAVSPDYSGLSIGKNLLLNFEAEAKNRNVKSIALTTDFDNNEDVLAFYTKAGYNKFYVFTAYPNRKMHKLLKQL